jgi:isoleucyl-tRNA synthetase
LKSVSSIASKISCLTLLIAIEETDFKVDWGKTRIYNMIRDRGEWVISRQRVWGVPLPCLTLLIEANHCGVARKITGFLVRQS